MIFLFSYSLESIKKCYYQNRFEIEALAAEERMVAYARLSQLILT